MKDHEIAKLVNDLRDIANQYTGSQQLRSRIHARLVPEIRKLLLRREAFSASSPETASMINDWHLSDKMILSDALKDIYAIRGEDTEVAQIILNALRNGCVPGY